MIRIVVLTLALLQHAVLASSAPTSPAQAQFEQLKTLVGTWAPRDSTSDNFKIEFELTARESVLVEKWLYSGKLHSMTVYHLDHDVVMATHYCPQGNQPRLVSMPKSTESTGSTGSTGTSKSTADDVSFAFKDATNLDKTSQSYQVALSFAFGEQTDAVVRRETYQKASEHEPSEMILVRKAGA